jgi:hypothetical protein
MESIKENQLNIKIWRLVLAIIIVNVLGFGLRYFGLNTFINILGFRFHISFVLPFFIVYNSNFIHYLKISFLKPECKNASFTLLIIILPMLIEAGGLFFLKKIDLGDPEYFYEFGISSIADYPIYLIWNFPQLLLLFIFLASVSLNSKFRFISAAMVVILLFVFEFIPLNNANIQYSDIGILISCSIICSFLIKHSKNIYRFGISLFTLFWIAILAFGSNSKIIINLLLASQYNNWEGFFEVDKQILPYTLLIYFGIALFVTIGSCTVFTRSDSDNFTSS